MDSHGDDETSAPRAPGDTNAEVTMPVCFVLGRVFCAGISLQVLPAKRSKVKEQKEEEEEKPMSKRKRRKLDTWMHCDSFCFRPPVELKRLQTHQGTVGPEKCQQRSEG